MTPRKYESPRRLEQANATRAAIIDAAARLFAERGYGATTMAAIAAEARVSAKSVYALGDKAQLLILALDRAIAGDDDTPLLERQQAQAVLTAATARDAVTLGAAMGAPMLLRLYPLYRAFEQAAAKDAQIAALWKEYQQRRRHDVLRRAIRRERIGSPRRTGHRAGHRRPLGTHRLAPCRTPRRGTRMDLPADPAVDRGTGDAGPAGAGQRSRRVGAVPHDRRGGWIFRGADPPHADARAALHRWARAPSYTGRKESSPCPISTPPLAMQSTGSD